MFYIFNLTLPEIFPVFLHGPHVIFNVFIVFAQVVDQPFSPILFLYNYLEELFLIIWSSGFFLGDTIAVNFFICLAFFPSHLLLEMTTCHLLSLVLHVQKLLRYGLGP